MSALGDILDRVPIPPMARVRQIFPKDGIRDVAGAVDTAIKQGNVLETIQPGMRVAITAGSRGVANIATVLRTVADMVRARGGEPFLVPAMGSHGGGTADGQVEILRQLGVTDDICPIKSDMSVVKVGRVMDTDVCIDKNAAEADGIIVVGRVKRHTAFRGPYESGLMKMMAIGLGKREGAAACHARGWKYMAQRIPAFGQAVLDGAHILFGLALIENELDETVYVEAVLPQSIPAREPELLKMAAERMPKLYLPETDVLVIDFIGKDISGDGADPNVSGAFATPYASGGIRFENLCFLDVTEKSHGSVAGVGVAQATTKRLVDKIDAEATFLNALTSRVLAAVRIPPYFSSDRAAIAACLEACTEIDRHNPRVVRIKNTMEIEHIQVSPALLDELRAHPHMEIESEPMPLPFDARGNLW